MRSRVVVGVCAGLAFATIARTQEAEDPAKVEAARLANAKAAVDLEQARINLERSKWAIPASGLTGAVTPGEGAGRAEAIVLSTAALGSAADALTTMLASCSTVVLYPGDEKPDRSRWQMFDFQIRRLRAELDAALAAAPNPAAAPPGFDPVSLVTAGSALLSYFKADYTVGGFDITPDNHKFGALLAGRLIAAKKPVYLASDYAPAMSDAISTPLRAADDAATAASMRALLLTSEAARTEDKARKAELEAAVTRLNAAVTTYRTYVASLGVPTEKGELPIDVISRQQQLTTLAPAGCAVNYRVSNVAGSHYTKRTILTTFGKTPFYVAAAVDVSYRAWEADGRLKNAGVISRNSGFIKAKKVLAARADATSSPGAGAAKD